MLRKIKERRSFLLSECLVACVLMSLLLGSLGYWTRRIWVSHKEKERSYKTFLLDAKITVYLEMCFYQPLSLKKEMNWFFPLIEEYILIPI